MKKASGKTYIEHLQTMVIESPKVALERTYEQLLETVIPQNEQEGPLDHVVDNMPSSPTQQLPRPKMKSCSRANADRKHTEKKPKFKTMTYLNLSPHHQGVLRSTCAKRSVRA